MRAVMTMMMVLVLAAGPAAAQTTMLPGTGSALGPTSPLAIPGAAAGVLASPAGIPLGATQLNVGGLSSAPGPLAGAGCSTVSGLSSTGTGTFDGGGLGSSGAIACGTANPATSTASGLVSAGAPATGTGSIPLGATEIDSGGLSPLIVSPAPGGGAAAMPAMTSSP
jgi:hypothetical protein